MSKLPEKKAAQAAPSEILLVGDGQVASFEVGAGALLLSFDPASKKTLCTVLDGGSSRISTSASRFAYQATRGCADPSSLRFKAVGSGSVLRLVEGALEQQGLKLAAQALLRASASSVYVYGGTDRLRSAGVVEAAKPTEARIQREASYGPLPIVAIGSSTGGTEALRRILVKLPARIPPIVVVQHIPPVFSKALAERLDELCPFRVLEAKDKDPILPDQVLIAPGGLQMRIERAEGGLRVRIDDAPPVNRHKPSVDYLFDSVASVLGPEAIGVILTGMGADGARGLLKMRQAGARTIGQDEKSSVVFGMPKEAAALGAVESVEPLEAIAGRLLEWLEKNKAA